MTMAKTKGYKGLYGEAAYKEAVARISFLIELGQQLPESKFLANTRAILECTNAAIRFAPNEKKESLMKEIKTNTLHAQKVFLAGEKG